MKLQKLEIKKLYGFMDKSITFNEQLNLLVGINGSGKTSILNVISWIMQPAFNELCTTEFEKISLTFYYENNKHIITCKQTDEKLEINVSIGKKRLYPLTITLRLPTSYYSKNPNMKEIFYPTYEKLQPQQNELDTWTYFLQLPNPIIIAIDRKFEQKSDKPNESKFKGKPGTNQSSSLEAVKIYSNEAYTSYNKKIIDLNKILRDKILLSSFESSIIDAREYNTHGYKLSVDDVNKLEVNITKFLKDDLNEMTEVLQSAVKKYASDMRKIVNDYLTMRYKESSNHDEDDKITSSSSRLVATNYFLNSNQFIRVQKLLIAFSKYERDSSEAFKTIDNYLKSINHFFKDSNKELFFKKENGQLYFHLKDINNIVFKSEQTIDSLSSGEKQILILFTYLAFGNTNGKIFIIDEPEISLHPKWQDDFLQQLNNVTPQETQLIIATHSPSIVGELEENCKILLPYNA